MIEINANPHRLDLDWVHARQGRTRPECAIVDQPRRPLDRAGLADLDYGIGIARKAG